MTTARKILKLDLFTIKKLSNIITGADSYNLYSGNPNVLEYIII